MSFFTTPFILFLACVDAAPHALQVKRAVTPTVSGTPEVIGVASDVAWTRDSCTSTRVRNRVLWTCRDSQSSDAFLSSTASWTNFTSDGTPNVEDGVLTMYGTNPLSAAYFAVQNDECGGSAGACSDGTRYALWQNTRPLPVDTGSDESMSLYTWVANTHITADLSCLNPNPSTSLYRSDYSPNATVDELPAATLVNQAFWPVDSISYGNYGFVISDNTAYLYGLLNGSATVALAKVLLDSIEDKTAYSYYTASGWSTTAPSLTDTSAAIANAGTGGQGTFYYSSYFSSFIWIGAPYYGDNARFLIATAPSPEGPWTTPTEFYVGEQGTAALGAYSQQAHPGLSEDYGSGRDIYLTYTKVDAKFSTPLIHVVWE
ncbi:hypothetical protein LTR85_011427 [Meristemomyces frigidus]|nr:hypothetical protein LTR85_011427 [Meristemomyces frigidus]